MRSITQARHFVVLVALPVLGACASSPPRELLDARVAYHEASQSRAPELASTELLTARESLKRAEFAFAEDGDETYVRDLAYIAERRAEFARMQSKVTECVRKRAQTERELLAATGLLAEQSAALEQRHIVVRDAAIARAEAWMRDASGRLTSVGDVHDEPRGTVITVPGGALFESGKYVLLRGAEDRLNALATVLLENPDTRIVIEGHTDALGADEFNRRLSEDRASEIREYLVGRGIAPHRILACGLGELRPVASNTSADGRVTNRRIEIVVGTPQSRLACAYL